MCVNIMVVISMDVRNVSLIVEKHTMNNNSSIAQRWRDTQMKEKKIERNKDILFLANGLVKFAEEKKET